MNTTHPGIEVDKDYYYLHKHSQTVKLHVLFTFTIKTLLKFDNYKLKLQQNCTFKSKRSADRTPVTGLTVKLTAAATCQHYACVCVTVCVISPHRHGYRGTQTTTHNCHTLAAAAAASSQLLLPEHKHSHASDRCNKTQHSIRRVQISAKTNCAQPSLKQRYFTFILHRYT